jgi:hypothetical protein
MGQKHGGHCLLGKMRDEAPSSSSPAVPQVHATTGSKSVRRRTSHPCLYITGPALLVCGCGGTEANISLCETARPGRRSPAACSLHQISPAPTFVLLFPPSHPSHTMMPTPTSATPHKTFKGKLRVLGLLCLCFLVLPRARLSLRLNPGSPRGIHEQAT